VQPTGRSRAVGLAVFDLVAPYLGDVVMLGVDDTLARKRGLKMFGTGMHHEPLLSSRGKAITNWGHSWVMLGVIVELFAVHRRQAARSRGRRRRTANSHALQW
jgi:hypothetical protein